MGTRGIALIALMLFAPPAAFCEHEKKDERGRMASETESIEATLNSAADVYRRVVNTPERQALASRSECIGVFPNVIQAALIVGGRHGDGVVACRTADTTWSSVSFVDLTGASLGAQLGGRSSELVLFNGEKAKSALRSGKLTLGADLSVTYGERQTGIGASTGDVVALAASEGLFAAAGFSGTVIDVDRTTNRALYGHEMKQGTLLTTPAESHANQKTQRFLNVLPKGAQA